VQRIRTWREFYEPLPDDSLQAQATRCMDCGVPFCQGDTGCPVENLIPEWNDLVSRRRWKDALDALHATNNFPEFTGRLCPAPCETACVLALIDKPVSIRAIEQAIIDRGFDEGWVTPLPPERESGKRVAVIGSGPAGLAAAQQLRRLGHGVVVYEQDDRVGGLLRYGIPDFKMEKGVLDRRLRQMEAEGVVFRTNARVGDTVTVEDIRREFDAICLAIGAGAARDLAIPGRELRGVHMAMEFLTQQNRIVAGDWIRPANRIIARRKRVAIIGGGDTGADCLGTCHRQRAAEVVQLYLPPLPPVSRAASTPWPLWPMQLRTSHAHEEGGRREWRVWTTGFSGRRGRVERLHAVRVEENVGAARGPKFLPVEGTEFTIDVDLVILAIGFGGPGQATLLTELGVELDAAGNVAAHPHSRMASVPGVFAAGDSRRGASLIVWAIREGRDTAAGIDRYLRRGPRPD
jgi:glutamate synthase (NADPH) small chain